MTTRKIADVSEDSELRTPKRVRKNETGNPTRLVPLDGVNSLMLAVLDLLYPDGSETKLAKVVFCQVGNPEPLMSFTPFNATDDDEETVLELSSGGISVLPALDFFAATEPVIYIRPEWPKLRILVEEGGKPPFKKVSITGEPPHVISFHFYGTPDFRRRLVTKAIRLFFPGIVSQYRSGSVVYVREKDKQGGWSWPLKYELPGLIGAPEAPVDVFDSPPETSNLSLQWNKLRRGPYIDWLQGTQSLFIFVAMDMEAGRAVHVSKGVSASVGPKNPFFHLGGFACRNLNYDHKIISRLFGNIRLLAFERSTKTVLGVQIARYNYKTRRIIRSVVCSIVPGVGTALIETFHQLVAEMAKVDLVDEITLSSLPSAITFHERTGYELRKSCKTEDRAEPSRFPQRVLLREELDTEEVIDRMIELTEYGVGPKMCEIPVGVTQAEKRLHWLADENCALEPFPMRKCVNTDSATRGGRRLKSRSRSTRRRLKSRSRSTQRRPKSATKST